MGDGERDGSYASEMELWHTDDNTVQTVGNPNIPGINIGSSKSFYRPVISSFDEDSIILIGSGIINNKGDTTSYLDQIYKYTYSVDGGQWEPMGKAKYHISTGCQAIQQCQK